MIDQARFLKITSEVVSAYMANNAVQASELAGLIEGVYSALHRITVVQPEAPAPEAAKPAVPIRKSVAPDYLVCLEDGKRFKSLKRHLRSRYNMSPEEYRAKWGLGADYPMVAPAYARERSQLAKEMGLGQQRRRLKR